MINLGIDISQSIPKGKVRIYKNCSKHIPYIGNYTNEYVDLDPGTYNDITLQLKDLKDNLIILSSAKSGVPLPSLLLVAI